jgi:hypothetical protein
VSDGLGRLGGQSFEVRVGVVAGVLTIAWAIAVLGPFGAATIDPDASSSVLYFQRLTTGVRLEAFVPTTPKPLLTLVDGVTWALVHDWRWLVWETIAAFGLAVGAAAAFTGRLGWRIVDSGGAFGSHAGGPAIAAIVAAAAFATGALLTSSDLMLEVSRANSLIWAIAFWSLAGLFIVADEPRPILAGTMLFLAGLVRFETLALDAVALLAFLVASPAASAGRRGRGRGAPIRPPGALAGVVIAFLALPVAMLHDLLLSGDPLYWLSVPSRYTAIFNPGLSSIGPVDYAGTYLDQIAPLWPLLLLAAVGLVAMARARELLALAGLLALGLGVTALLFTLAFRGIYISNRYYEPITVALIGAAAVGVGWLAGSLLGRVPAVGMPASLAVGAILGVLLLWPALPWDKRASTELSDVRTASERLAAAMPNLDVVIHDLQPPPPALVVPSRDVARVAVELPASLRRIDNSYATLPDDGVAGFPEGAVVFHDNAADRPVALYKPLEIDSTGTVDGVSLTRLPLDVQGTWLLRVGAGGA